MELRSTGAETDRQSERQLTTIFSLRLISTINFEETNYKRSLERLFMAERILPFFQRGEQGLRWAGQPKAWPDNRVLCRLSSSAKDALTLAEREDGRSEPRPNRKWKTVGARTAAREGLFAHRVRRPSSLRQNRRAGYLAKIPNRETDYVKLTASFSVEDSVQFRSTSCRYRSAVSKLGPRRKTS